MTINGSKTVLKLSTIYMYISGSMITDIRIVSTTA